MCILHVYSIRFLEICSARHQNPGMQVLSVGHAGTYNIIIIIIIICIIYSLVVSTILKNISQKILVNGKDYPIYYGK